MRKRHSKIRRKCLNCGKDFYTWYARIKIGKGIFCSISCGKKGKFNYAWRGGINHRDGYNLILKPNHPFADKKGYIYEHRLIMEKKLRRYLTKEEVVDHINHRRDDNRIENLELYPNQAVHISKHMEGNKIWLGKKHKKETIKKMEKTWTRERKNKQSLDFIGIGNPNYRHGRYV